MCFPAADKKKCDSNTSGFVTVTPRTADRENVVRWINSLPEWVKKQCAFTSKVLPSIQFNSVQLLSHVRLSATPWIAAPQAGLPVHHQLPEFTQPHFHQVGDAIQPSHPLSSPFPSSRWCHPTISSSVIPFSSCPQSLPASGSFPMSQLFSWGSLSIGVSASTSVLPMNTQDWSPLRWTGWISLQSKGLQHLSSKALG